MNLVFQLAYVSKMAAGCDMNLVFQLALYLR